MEVFEVGADLLALLLYPEKKAEMKRLRLYISLCALVVQGTYFNQHPAKAFQPQLMKPIYVFRSEREISRDMRAFDRRHRDRIIAGRMALAFLKKANGITLNLPGGDERLSINRLSELVLTDAGYTEPENVETRIWRPSVPVIHIAAAVQILLHRSPTPLQVCDLVHHRPLIEWVVRAAEEFEGVFARNSFRGIDARKLIKLRLAAS
jgi:hypothetical protein